MCCVIYRPSYPQLGFLDASFCSSHRTGIQSTADSYGQDEQSFHLKLLTPYYILKFLPSEANTGMRSRRLNAMTYSLVTCSATMTKSE